MSIGTFKPKKNLVFGGGVQAKSPGAHRCLHII